MQYHHICKFKKEQGFDPHQLSFGVVGILMSTIYPLHITTEEMNDPHYEGLDPRTPIRIAMLSPHSPNDEFTSHSPGFLFSQRITVNGSQCKYLECEVPHGKVSFLFKKKIV